MRARTLDGVALDDLPIPRARAVIAVQVQPTSSGLLLVTGSLYYAIDKPSTVTMQLALLFNRDNIDTILSGGSNAGVEGPLWYEAGGSPLTITSSTDVLFGAFEAAAQAPGPLPLGQNLGCTLQAPIGKKSVALLGIDTYYGGQATLSGVFGAMSVVELP